MLSLCFMTWSGWYSFYIHQRFRIHEPWWIWGYPTRTVIRYQNDIPQLNSGVLLLVWQYCCHPLHGMSTPPKITQIYQQCTSHTKHLGLVLPLSASSSPGYTTEQILEELHESGPWGGTVRHWVFGGYIGEHQMNMRNKKRAKQQKKGTFIVQCWYCLHYSFL